MERDFKYTNGVVARPFFFVFFLWLIYWLEIRYDFDFVENGIFPRTFSGLQGVLFSPFIHSDLNHLFSNTIPLLVLLAALQFFYRKQSTAVVIFGILMSGFITWVIGRPNFHIGASSLIYVLVSFIFFKGIQTKYYRLVALSLAVIVVYGGMVWYVFPKIDDTISWEGHLAGFVAGYMLSIVLKTPEYEKVIKYDWQHPDYDSSEDKFMQRFDADGNFVNLPEIEEDELSDTFENYFSSDRNLNYVIPENKKDESKPEF